MIQPRRSRPGRSRRFPRPLVVGLVAFIAAGCMTGPVAGPTTAPSAATADPTVAATPAAPSPSASPAAATSTPTATPAAVLDGPLAGAWRVRRVLALDDCATLVPGAAFTDEAYIIKASCEAEPCPEIVVSARPAGRARPVTETTLRREGDHYASAASEGVDVPCRNEFGDRVPGGATASTTLRLWLTSTRPAGTAVETETLTGTLELAITPTDLGTSAGCMATAAAYDLTGKRGAVAVIGEVKPPSEIPEGVATAPLPDVEVDIRGATIEFFDVEGTTVDELAEGIGRGALRACGGIDYEWLEGDPTPAACTITHFPDFESSIDERTSGGSCTIQADPEVRFTVHLPRWSGPARVPAVLVDWWRDTVEFIRAHEAGHVRISLEHTEELDLELDGARCSRVEEVIQDWITRLSDAQEAFDRREYQRSWPEPPRGM